MSDLTIRELQEINAHRKEEWHKNMLPWTLGDWGNAMAGECGEACNVIKKIRRQQCGQKGTLDPDITTLRFDLGEELADTMLYLLLVAQEAGLDMEEEIRGKFNSVSIREGFPQRL